MSQRASVSTTFGTGVATVKQPHLALKIAVVGSSLLLGGCFVSYHAGAFRWLTKPAVQPAASTSTLTPEDNPSEGTPQPASAVISGTKSLLPRQFISGLTPVKPSSSDAAGQPPSAAANRESPGSNESKPAP